MNWTGGRLRRQSHNRPDSTLKIQKQHFARARLKQRESHKKARIASTIGQPFTFCSVGVAELPPQQATQLSQPIERINRPFELFESPRDSQGSFQLRSGISKTHAKSSERDPHIPYIDLLKQYLLGKRDWVGLSPTRPLKMKFTPIEEKEQIGKRRKLSRDEEARSTAMARNAPNISRIVSHGFNAQVNPRANAILDWGDMNIQISTPKEIGHVYEIFESPIRPTSASSEYMLSSVQEAEEEYDTNAFSAEGSRLVELDMPEEPPRDHFVKRHGSSKGKISTTLPETRAELRSSPIPVLHRFTLDDQVLAERIAESQREAQSSGARVSGYRDFYLNRTISGHQQDEPDEHETLLSFSVRSRTDDRCTDITDSHETNPTDSDVLPQTQKISRRLPPSQPRLTSDVYPETPIRNLKSIRDISVTENRPINKPISIEDDNNKSPTLIFGQEVNYSIPPAQTDPETTLFRFQQSSIHRKSSFMSNIHGYQPPSQFNNTSKSNKNTTNPANTILETPRPPSKTFRFPSHWTPHHNIQQLGLTTDKPTFRVSAFTTPLPQRPPFINVLLNTDQHGRQSAGCAMRNTSPGNLYEDLNYCEDQRVMLPVFNTPFRR